MPRKRPAPVSLEPGWLDRSLNRHLAAGIVLMGVLIAAFVLYKIREPELRATARGEQVVGVHRTWQPALRQQLLELPRRQR